MKFRAVLASSTLLSLCAFCAEKDPVVPLPEGQRPGPLVEIQFHEATQPRTLAYLTSLDDSKLEIVMLDGKEKRTLSASSVASMKVNPILPPPAKVADDPETGGKNPDRPRRDPDDRPGILQGDMRERMRFLELLHKQDSNLTEAERQEYQKARERYGLPDKTTMLSIRGEVRQAFKRKEGVAFIEQQRKELKSVPALPFEENRKRMVALVYAYEMQRVPPREIIDKCEDDLPAQAGGGPELRLKRKNMVSMLVWDILNHGPE